MGGESEPSGPGGGGGHRATGLQAVRALLDGSAVAYRVVEHGKTFTAMEEAEATGRPAGRIAKTVVVIERGNVCLAVVSAARRLDLERLRAVLGAGPHLRLATENEIAAAFPDLEVGAIPPLGRLLGVDAVIDPLVLHHSDVMVAGGDHEHSLVLDPQRLVDAAGARVADICVHVAGDHLHRFGDVPLT